MECVALSAFRRSQTPRLYLLPAPSLHNYPGNCGVIGGLTCSQDALALFYQQLELNLREEREKRREKCFIKKEAEDWPAQGTITLLLRMEMYENAPRLELKNDRKEKSGMERETESLR